MQNSQLPRKQGRKRKSLTGSHLPGGNRALREAMRQLELSLERERQLSTMKSRFVAMASHEFRSPLSTILSSAYLIEQYKDIHDQPKRKKHLDRIVTAVNTLTEILNEFLCVGKLEEGKIQVRLSELAITDWLPGIVADMSGCLRKGQHIYYQHEGEEEVITDPSLLRHILLNLVSNASKFSAESRPIDVRTKCDGKMFVLIVTDSGMGIAPEDMGHLTELFYRGCNASNIQGTGLGLHIVARYVDLLRGRIYCESTLDRGTNFRIEFPQSEIRVYEKSIAD